MKVREKVKNILESNPFDKKQEFDKWLEQVLIHVLEEIKEEQEEKLEQKADKIDIKLLIERSDDKFISLQKEMNTRFETLQKEMNTRFEAVNTRFEAMQKEINARFEAVNARFEAIEKRFSSLQWMIGVGFTLLAIMMTLSNFIKK